MVALKAVAEDTNEASLFLSSSAAAAAAPPWAKTKTRQLNLVSLYQNKPGGANSSMSEAWQLCTLGAGPASS